MNAVFSEKSCPFRKKATNAHSGTGVEGKLFDIDLTVSERHKEDIEHIKSECNARQNSCNAELFVRVLFPCIADNNCRGNDGQQYVANVSRTEAGEHSSALFIG